MNFLNLSETSHRFEMRLGKRWTIERMTNFKHVTGWTWDARLKRTCPNEGKRYIALSIQKQVLKKLEVALQ